MARFSASNRASNDALLTSSPGNQRSDPEKSGDSLIGFEIRRTAFEKSTLKKNRPSSGSAESLLHTKGSLHLEANRLDHFSTSLNITPEFLGQTTRKRALGIASSSRLKQQDFGHRSRVSQTSRFATLPCSKQSVEESRSHLSVLQSRKRIRYNAEARNERFVYHNHPVRSSDMQDSSSLRSGSRRDHAQRQNNSLEGDTQNRRRNRSNFSHSSDSTSYTDAYGNELDTSDSSTHSSQRSQPAQFWTPPSFEALAADEQEESDHNVLTDDQDAAAENFESESTASGDDADEVNDDAHPENDSSDSVQSPRDQLEALDGGSMVQTNHEIETEGRPRILRNSFGSAFRAINEALTGYESSRLGSLLSAIESKEEDPSGRLAALQELSNILMLSSEDSVTGYLNPDPMLKVLSKIIKQDNEGTTPEMVLLACRCISGLLEILPSSASFIFRYDLISSLSEKLLDIQFIDVAEQALSALEKISGEFPREVARRGGIQAPLAYIDFFSAPVQRIALNIFANSCAHLPEDLLETATENLPKLNDLMKSMDEKIIHQACFATCKIIDVLWKKPDLIHSLITDEILDTLIDLVRPTHGSMLTYEGQTQILSALTSMAKVSTVISEKLLSKNIDIVIALVLSGNIYEEGSSNSDLLSSALNQKVFYSPQAQKCQALNLLISILPPVDPEAEAKNLVQDSDITSETNTETSSNISFAYLESKNKVGDFKKINEILLPLVMETYVCSLSSKLKKKSLLALFKLLTSVPRPELVDILKHISLSSFLACIFAQPSENIKTSLTLSLVEFLQVNLSEIYVPVLRREGIIAWISSYLNNTEESPNSNGRTRSRRFVAIAKKILENQQKSESRLELDDSERTRILTSVYQGLTDYSRKPLKAYGELALIFEKYGGATAHELMTSKIDEALLESFNKYGDSAVKDFIIVFIKRYNKNPNDSHGLRNFILTLQAVLNQLDRCSVYVAQPEDSRAKDQTLMLTKQVRIRLSAKDKSQVPDMYQNFMVSVHAVATLKAISNYLEVRITPLKPVSSELSQNSMASNSLNQEDISAINVEAIADESISNERASLHESEFSTAGNSYANAVKGNFEGFKVVFEYDGNRLAQDLTVFNILTRVSSQPIDWSTVPSLTFYFEPRSSQNENASEWPNFVKSEEVDGHNVGNSDWLAPKFQTTLLLLRVLFNARNIAADAFDAVKASQLRSLISPSEFLNQRLTTKLNWQLEEPLVVASFCLPPWTQYLVKNFFFLFPFETRLIFLQSTSFGYSRCINRWFKLRQANASREEQMSSLGRIQRQKLRISRNRILESAIKLMDLYGKTSPLLEIEYFEEVGSGLGPTLEFYALASKELQRKSLHIWRGSDDKDIDSEHKTITNELEKSNDGPETSELVCSSSGLFPAPIDPRKNLSAANKHKLLLFRFIGQFVARSLLDSRIIDIPFNPAFFDQNLVCTTEALLSVDKNLARSLKFLQQFLDLGCEQNESLEIDGTKISDLGLDFVLPGFPDIELVENGRNMPVEGHNLRLYLSKVLDFMLGSGIELQLNAFSSGFNTILPAKSLDYFTAEELVSLFGQSEEDWSLQTLREALRADHGYTMDNPVIEWFVEILSEFTKPQRRQFLQFATGAPKLPTGGFRSLNPALTIVRKTVDGDKSADDYLPSVMTCVNYLKMPSYSSKEVMNEKMSYAMSEGKDSFHLS